MKLWSMNVHTKTKVLLKFGSLETVCVDGKVQKTAKISHIAHTCKARVYEHALRHVNSQHLVSRL